jgi:hypothetical protein
MWFKKKKKRLTRVHTKNEQKCEAIRPLGNATGALGLWATNNFINNNIDNNNNIKKMGYTGVPKASTDTTILYGN